MEAVAALIIPSDETPGAREAGVVYFIDQALAGFDRDQQAVYREGLKKLGGTFAKLAGEQQETVLRSIEKTPFFEQIWKHTLMGMFANSEYGGNRGNAGWKLIGFEDSFEFKAPFGHYDREISK